MAARSSSRVLTGRDADAPLPTVLRAGPLTLLLDGTDLRRIRLGDVELIQRVYMAVRDAPWNTIPATTSDWRIEAGPDRFRVAFRARHRHEAIDYEWTGLLEGSPAGVIRYAMDGVCHGSFKYSKIGLNVHHPLDGSIGRPYRARTLTGELRGVLPAAIDPQRIVDGKLSGMFEPYSELAIEVVDGLESVISLEGDLLELQDHRNWTDGNVKSYATPLALGFPFDSSDGLRIRQVLTIGFRGSVPVAEPTAMPTITVGPPGPARLPAIGFGQASHGLPLSPREVALVAAAAPRHLRVDLAVADPDHVATLERAAADARATGAALELAISANDRSGGELATLAAHLRRLGGPVARVLVYAAADGFSAVSALTPAPIVRLVREALEPVLGPIVFAGGTNSSFVDINRDRPRDPVMTGICFAISPTIHAVDDLSIVENLVGQSEVVTMARSIADGRAVCVSPVTLATRFGPYPGGPPAPVDLPAPVDVRQASLLGAAWTVGSLAELAASGADSVTYFETSGWRGIVERDGGSPDPRFPSRPGDVLPMYHVFADLGAWRAATLVASGSSDPLQVTALFVATPDGRTHGLVASLVPGPTSVALTGLPNGPAHLRRLDLASADRPCATPKRSVPRESTPGWRRAASSCGSGPTRSSGSRAVQADAAHGRNAFQKR